jgi:hypothetical protein
MEGALQATDMEALVVFEGTIGMVWFVGHMTPDRINAHAENIPPQPEESPNLKTNGHKHVGSSSEKFAVQLNRSEGIDPGKLKDRLVLIGARREVERPLVSPLPLLHPLTLVGIIAPEWIR